MLTFDSCRLLARTGPRPPPKRPRLHQWKSMSLTTSATQATNTSPMNNRGKTLFPQSSQNPSGCASFFERRPKKHGRTSTATLPQPHFSFCHQPLFSLLIPENCSHEPDCNRHSLDQHFTKGNSPRNAFSSIWPGTIWLCVIFRALSQKQNRTTTATLPEPHF